MFDSMEFITTPDKAKNMPDHARNRTYDLPKVIGSIPAVVRQMLRSSPYLFSVVPFHVYFSPVVPRVNIIMNTFLQYHNFKYGHNCPDHYLSELFVSTV